ncbi:hypothetical protein [Nocardia wallacei]|uniref:hypothetical protein n=1 Tax=Nocardia wallacei TaxID=480035 RepID=UPI002456FBE4|nr:hypothetical protein [Nocardia wallacei]
MGFRTVIISEDAYVSLPRWFVDKHTDLHVGTLLDGTPSLPLSSRFERKFYASKDDSLFLDLQQVLRDLDHPHAIDLVLFHECGGITKVSVSRERIRMSEPAQWQEVDAITHNYCYGCSEVDEHIAPPGTAMVSRAPGPPRRSPDAH